MGGTGAPGVNPNTHGGEHVNSTKTGLWREEMLKGNLVKRENVFLGYS